MANQPLEDTREIRQLINQMEAELVNFGKAVRAKPYSVMSIKRKLAKNFAREDFIVKIFDGIEEKLVLLSKVFNLRCDFSDTKPFFTMLYRKFVNPPRQTLITDWIEQFKRGNEKKDPPTTSTT